MPLSPRKNGLDSLFNQDMFDHDKGQKSAISGRRLHWRLSTDFFAFSPGSLCNLVRRAHQNLEKGAKNPVEKIASNPVMSVAVMVFRPRVKEVQTSKFVPILGANLGKNRRAYTTTHPRTNYHSRFLTLHQETRRGPEIHG